jgi:phage shock protein PspC (stress-responsive transcriptional regulator)/membrane protein implicated in regulation of membrane protease activity
MNEITRIHLGRQPFVIAVDAHKELRDYLDAIKEAVGKSHKEVIEEVELRMAELLVERGITDQKTILKEDIQFLKEQLGKPGDFKGEEDEQDAESADEQGPDAPKRLFRDEKNGMIAGVCSGLAAFFNIDAVVVRLIFILLTLIWGWGILLYILLWIIVPPAKTGSDRLKMRGKAVTVDNLTKAVNREVTAAANRAGKAGKAMGELASGIFRVIMIVIGASIVTVGMAATCAVWAAGGYVAMNHTGLLGNLISFPVGVKETVLAVAAFVAANLILLWLTLTGMTMITRKWQLPGWITASTVALFLMSVVLGAVAAPDVYRQVRDRYEATRKTTELTTESPFNKVEIKGNLSFRYEKSSQYKVELDHTSNQNPATVKTVVKDNKLTIDAVEFLGKVSCKDFCIELADFPEAIIYAPSIEHINVDNYADLYNLRDGDRYRSPIER